MMPYNTHYPRYDCIPLVSRPSVVPCQIDHSYTQEWLICMSSLCAILITLANTVASVPRTTDEGVLLMRKPLLLRRQLQLLSTTIFSTVLLVLRHWGLTDFKGRFKCFFTKRLYRNNPDDQVWTFKVCMEPSFFLWRGRVGLKICKLKSSRLILFLKKNAHHDGLWGTIVITST